MTTFQLQYHDYQFSPKLVPTLITMLIIPILIALGIWQLNRAEEKHQIDQGVIQAQNKAPLDINLFLINQDNFSDQIYRNAFLTGRYDTNINFLLDNRTHQGKAGFQVLTPFLLNYPSNNPKAILINRGWIAYQGTRNNIQDITTTNKTRKILGTIQKIGDSIILAEDNNKSSSSYPKIIQSISVEKLSNEINYKLLPIIIQLDKSEESGFTREWQPYYGTADKSTAYAVQWFSMAFVLLALFIKINTRKIKLKH